MSAGEVYLWVGQLVPPRAVLSALECDLLLPLALPVTKHSIVWRDRL